MSPLYHELHRWKSLRFIWGETDCMMCVADWILRVTGRDPAADMRGSYDSRGSCQRETGFLRDPVAAVEKCLATIGGLPRVQEPRKGDIAVILAWDAEGRVGPCGAIWMGDAWGCKGPSGTTTINPRVAQVVHDENGIPAIWSVGYEA